MASVRRTATAVEVRAYAGRDPLSGKVRNLYRSLPATATEVEVAELAATLQAAADALRGRGVPWTVAGVVGFYLDSIAPHRSPTYMDGLRSNARCYVDPFIGSRAADSLRPYELARLYQRLMAHGGKDGRPVAAATVIKLHGWLKPAFASLVAMGVMSANPLEGVSRPRAVPAEVMPLCDADLAALSAYLGRRSPASAGEGALLDAALLVDLNTGLRAGELAGLRARDYDARSASLSVRRVVARARGRGLFAKPPKSRAGLRRVAVGERTASALAELKLAARSPDAPLFPAAAGGLRDPRDFTRHLHAVAREIGLSGDVHLHTLRHTHATYLLEGGTPMRVVQERLGHSTINTTLAVYGHVLPGRDADAAARFDSILEGLNDGN